MKTLDEIIDSVDCSHDLSLGGTCWGCFRRFVCEVVEERDTLFLEQTRLQNRCLGLEKANQLLNASLESVCESRDQLKQRVRELESTVSKE